MNLSVLIPWRTDHGSRERVFNKLRPLWDITGADICVGTDTGEGPFNCAMAQNDAFSKAKYDNLVMFGADMYPDIGVLNASLERLEEGEPWFPLFERTAYFSREDSERLLNGYRYSATLEYEHIVPFCTGVVGLTRATYIEAGGMDERFMGWGMEDAAFRHTLNALYPNPLAFPATLECLWHDEGQRGKASDRNWELIREYETRPERERMKAYLEERGSFV